MISSIAADADGLTFQWCARRCLLGLLHQFGHSCRLFFFVMPLERLAVFLQRAFNAWLLTKKSSFFFGLGLGHCPLESRFCVVCNAV